MIVALENKINITKNDKLFMYSGLSHAQIITAKQLYSMENVKLSIVCTLPLGGAFTIAINRYYFRIKSNDH